MMKLKSAVFCLQFLGVAIAALVCCGAGENLSEAQQAPKLVDLGYAYGHSNSMLVNFAFVVENPNRNWALEKNHYHAIAYDKNGTIIATKEGWIAIILPGERLGIADILVLPETRDIADLDIQIDSQRYVQTDLDQNPLSATNSSFIPHQFAPKVAGILKNSMNQSITNVKMTAILFDIEGRIIGGGSSTISSVPPNITMGVQIEVATRGEPASFQLYPSFYEHSLIESHSGMIEPVTAETLQNARSSNAPIVEKFNLRSVGFIQDAYGNVHYGFVVSNLDDILSLYATNYQATAFDKSNNVIGATSGTIPLTFPNEKMGVTGSLRVPEGGRVARLEIAIDQQSADGFELPVSNPLTSDRLTFIPSTLQPKVTGIVRNSLDKDIQYVPLDVIAYDGDGKIIGVGDGLISSVPTEGNAAADVFIYVADQPDRLELYPQITNPMEMGWY